MHHIKTVGVAAKDMRGLWVAKSVIVFPDEPNRRLTIRTGKSHNGALSSRAVASTIIGGMEVTCMSRDFNQLMFETFPKRITEMLVNSQHAFAMQEWRRDALESAVRAHYTSAASKIAA